MRFKGQNLALKWVQRNIIYFDGDKNNVTIFCYVNVRNAAGGSVHMHILSKTSKGLFHKTILQSGFSLISWFWGSKNNARKIVKQLGKRANSENEALEILKGCSGREIHKAQEKLFEVQVMLTIFPSFLFLSDITQEIKPGSLDDKSIRTFVELWTNFAEYGTPTPDDKLNVLWKPGENEDNIKVLDFGEKLVFRDIPERNRLNVWWDILKKWPFVKFD